MIWKIASVIFITWKFIDKLEALRITILETVEIEVGNILGNTYKIVIDVMDRKVSIWKKLHR